MTSDVLNDVLRDGRVQLSEVELHYVEGPDAGPPLVFIHGTSARWQAWVPIIPSFIDSYHVYAVDLRGCGESGWTPSRYSFSDSATDVVEFLRAVVQQPAILVGHSRGAVVSTLVAAKAPDTVKAIVVEDPPLYREEATYAFRDFFGPLHALLSERPSKETIEQWLRQRFSEDTPDAFIASRTADLVALDPTFLAQTQSAEMWDEMAMDEEVIPRIACPTLLLHGDRDAAVWPSALTAESVAGVAERLPQCTVKFIDNAGHLIHARQQGRFLEAVKEFLAKIE